MLDVLAPAGTPCAPWERLDPAPGFDEVESAVGWHVSGVFVLDALVPAGTPCASWERLDPAPGLDEVAAAPMPSESVPSSISFHMGTFNSFATLLYSCRPFPFGRATTPSYAAVPGIL